MTEQNQLGDPQVSFQFWLCTFFFSKFKSVVTSKLLASEFQKKFGFSFKNPPVSVESFLDHAKLYLLSVHKIVKVQRKEQDSSNLVRMNSKFLALPCLRATNSFRRLHSLLSSAYTTKNMRKNWSQINWLFFNFFEFESLCSIQVPKKFHVVQKNFSETPPLKFPSVWEVMGTWDLLIHVKHSQETSET